MSASAYYKSESNEKKHVCNEDCSPTFIFPASSKKISAKIKELGRPLADTSLFDKAMKLSVVKAALDDNHIIDYIFSSTLLAFIAEKLITDNEKLKNALDMLAKEMH